jgi:hypothetical protein
MNSACVTAHFELVKKVVVLAVTRMIAARTPKWLTPEIGGLPARNTTLARLLPQHTRTAPEAAMQADANNMHAGRQEGNTRNVLKVDLCWRNSDARKGCHEPSNGGV